MESYNEFEANGWKTHVDPVPLDSTFLCLKRNCSIEGVFDVMYNRYDERLNKFQIPVFDYWMPLPKKKKTIRPFTLQEVVDRIGSAVVCKTSRGDIHTIVGVKVCPSDCNIFHVILEHRSREFRIDPSEFLSANVLLKAGKDLPCGIEG
jgi:hypothetical protein